MQLSGRWKWSRTKVKYFLKYLEKEQQIKLYESHSTSIITIINYDLYQSNIQQKNNRKAIEKQQVVQQKDNREATEKQQKSTNKNDNNDNNDNNDKNDKNNKENVKFSGPTLNEVKLYCQERKSSVDPQAFIDFYMSKGWKIGKSTMKDWQAAVRTWENRDKKTAQPQKISAGW
jgi:hypothetical protein